MEKIAPGGGCGGMDALARLDHSAGRKIACINLAIHSLVLNEWLQWNSVHLTSVTNFVDEY